MLTGLDSCQIAFVVLENKTGLSPQTGKYKY